MGSRTPGHDRDPARIAAPGPGGAVATVAADESWPVALAADADALYWLDQHVLRDGADQPDERSGRLRSAPRRCAADHDPPPGAT